MKTERIYKQSDLQNLIASLPGYVCLKDEDGLYIACNDLQAQHLGFKFAEQLLGKTDFELLGVKSRAQKIRNEEIEVMEQRVAIIREEFCKVGEKERTLLNQKNPFFNSEGTVIGIIYTSVDITEKKELEEQTWILEDIIGKLPVHVWWKDKSLKFLGCNDQQAKTVGLKSRYEIKGKIAYDVITKEQSEAERIRQAQKIDKVDKKVIETGESHTVEEELVLQDGRKVIYLSHKAPLRDSSGIIIGLIGTSMDITDHKNAERLQLENEVYKAEKKSQEKFIKFIDKMQHEMQTYRTEALNEKLGTTKLQITDFDKQINLTKREREVLYYLSFNKSPKEIAKIIGDLGKKKVCDSTINAIINKQLYPKFEVFSIGQLIEKATALRLINFLPE